jgi:hypothetical protein
MASGDQIGQWRLTRGEIVVRPGATQQDACASLTHKLAHVSIAAVERVHSGWQVRFRRTFVVVIPWLGIDNGLVSDAVSTYDVVHKVRFVTTAEMVDDCNGASQSIR